MFLVLAGVALVSAPASWATVAYTVLMLTVTLGCFCISRDTELTQYKKNVIAARVELRVYEELVQRLAGVHAAWDRAERHRRKDEEWRRAEEQQRHAYHQRRLAEARRLAARPPPRLVRSPQDAEDAAADWMRYLGFPDACRTPDGADGGIDVTSSRGVAQVKLEGKPTGRPSI